MTIYFYGCVTMDGYLADSQHRIDWLDQLAQGLDEAESTYPDFYAQMDVTIMGKRTFDHIAQMEGAEDFYAQTTNYVLTHATELGVANYQPVVLDVVELVRSIPAEKNVFVVGGNSLIAPLLEADLFDHLIIQVAPVLLGAGIPLFTQAEKRQFYHLREVNQYGPFAEMVFDRKP